MERPVAMNFYSKAFPELGGALFFRNFNLGFDAAAQNYGNDVLSLEINTLYARCKYLTPTIFKRICLLLINVWGISIQMIKKLKPMLDCTACGIWKEPSITSDITYI